VTAVVFWIHKFCRLALKVVFIFRTIELG